MNRKIFLVFAIFLLILLGGLAQLFLIGLPVDGNSVVCEVEEWENQVNIYVTTPSSALAFTDAHLHQKGTILSISMRQVLVSPFYSSGSRMIWLEKGTETEIWLGGKCIWTAEP